MTELFSKFTPDEQKKIYEKAVGKKTDENFNEYNLLNLSIMISFLFEGYYRLL